MLLKIFFIVGWKFIWMGVWYELEAFILDKAYLSRLQSINSACIVRKPVIDFERNNTYIQSEGINQDFGIYDCPDNLLKEHHQEMSALKAFLYRNLGRHLMNRNIKKTRNSFMTDFGLPEKMAKPADRGRSR